MSLLNCKNLHFSIGDRVLLDNASLQIEKGERIGLLGRNGEGKSTLLRILGGELEPDKGEVIGDGPVRVAGLPQIVPADIRGTVMSVIAAGLPRHASGDHPVERLGSLLGLDLDHPFVELSGGQKRRALLGRALAGEPDVLLLDEPTNHLDLDGILWIEKFLQRFNGSVIFVTHDRAFLQRLATRIVELDRGRLSSWACDYATFLQRKEEFLVGEEKQWAQFDKKLAQEEVWIRQGIKARRTRDEGRVRALERLREKRSERRARVGQANIRLQAAERSGQKVIDAKKISFAYPSETDSPIPIVHEFTTTIMRGDKVGIIGPNGCGKTTLLNLLLDRLKPQTGTVQHGTSLQVSYFDQHRDELESERSVFDNVADGNDKVMIDGVDRHVIGYLNEFLFSPDRVRMPVKHLSGGERCRLLLARLFTRPSNVLVMDEPTNDLDTETLELLEARLLEYPGTLLLVSHDRQFLDNLCTSSMVFEGDGIINEYVGGYTDWQNAIARSSGAVKSRDNTGKTMAAAGPRKLNNIEREEFKSLPARIEALEREEEELQARMSKADFYRGDPTTVKTAAKRSQIIPQEIESAYTRWSELSERA
ncbi:MAG: ATP-binding cassette domain-containing protein [Verrucomicrobia bacterium]|nr:ATP-binding cassette domain-containing protein [Verrucomicrobiota bacterium]